MDKKFIALTLLGFFLGVVFAAAWINRYDLAKHESEPGSYMLDKWTGSVYFVMGDQWIKVEEYGGSGQMPANPFR